MEEKLLVTSRELIMVALICTAALSGVSGLVKKVSNPHIFKYLYKFIFFYLGGHRVQPQHHPRGVVAKSRLVVRHGTVPIAYSTHRHAAVRIGATKSRSGRYPFAGLGSCSSQW